RPSSGAPWSGPVAASAARRASGMRFSDATATSAATSASTRAPCSAIRRRSLITRRRNTMPGDTAHKMRINTEIFKAYDVRGLYPGEINEEVARQIGRGFITYLGAKKIAVSRD